MYWISQQLFQKIPASFPWCSALYIWKKKKKETLPLKGFYTVTSYDMELVV